MTQSVNGLYSQKYNTNLMLLAQQRASKFGDKAIVTNAEGSEAVRLQSFVANQSVEVRASRAEPAPNVSAEFDGRWAYPISLYDGKVIDPIDTRQTNIEPNSQLLAAQVAAMNRQEDTLFLNAFYGAAKAGKSGGDTVNFDSNNIIPVVLGSSGGATPTMLNKAKLDAAFQRLLDNSIDLDMERPIIGLTPAQHSILRQIDQATSIDYANKKPLAENGIIDSFAGFDVIVSTLIPTDADGYYRIPVWVKSCMGKGLWQDLKGIIRKRPDLKEEPDFAEVTKTVAFSRLQEAGCLEIKCTAS